MISYESSYSILIGHRIRNERIALGMTQSEFAKLLGISPSYLGALERGTRPVSHYEPPSRKNTYFLRLPA